MADIPSVFTLSLAVLFGLIGAVQLAGPPFLRNAYRHWDYPQRVRVVTGLLDFAASMMLILPSVRGWGIALAAILIFGAVVTLLNHRQYAWAAAVIVMMPALVPAALAVPRSDHVQFSPTKPKIMATD
jgi:hypothetical protein